MYLADVAERQRMDKDRLLTKLFGPKYDLLYSPGYDRRVSDNDFYRLLHDSVKLDYRVMMEEEDLFHRDQNYKNVRLWPGDEALYVNWNVLAHTNAEKDIAILPPERMPYDQPWEFVLRHEMEHCVEIVSEYLTDVRAADPVRTYRRSNIRVSY